MVTIWEHSSSLLTHVLFAQGPGHREKGGYVIAVHCTDSVFAMSFKSMCKRNLGYCLRELWGSGKSSGVLLVVPQQAGTVTC